MAQADDNLKNLHLGAHRDVSGHDGQIVFSNFMAVPKRCGLAPGQGRAVLFCDCIQSEWPQE